jgi:hypothetical protein
MDIEDMERGSDKDTNFFRSLGFGREIEGGGGGRLIKQNSCVKNLFLGRFGR